MAEFDIRCAAAEGGRYTRGGALVFRDTVLRRLGTLEGNETAGDAHERLVELVAWPVREAAGEDWDQALGRVYDAAGEMRPARLMFSRLTLEGVPIPAALALALASEADRAAWQAGRLRLAPLPDQVQKALFAVFVT